LLERSRFITFVQNQSRLSADFITLYDQITGTLAGFFYQMRGNEILCS